MSDLGDIYIKVGDGNRSQRMVSLHKEGKPFGHSLQVCEAATNVLALKECGKILRRLLKDNTKMIKDES